MVISQIVCAGFVHFSARHTEDCEGLADSDWLREGVRGKDRGCRRKDGEARTRLQA